MATRIAHDLHAIASDIDVLGGETGGDEVVEDLTVLRAGRLRRETIGAIERRQESSANKATERTSQRIQDA
jgi:hypothetical protein